MDWVRRVKGLTEQLAEVLDRIDRYEMEADELRDKLDGSWYRLTEEQKDEVREYSVELNQRLNLPEKEHS